MSIKQTVTFKATAEEIYSTLLSSNEFGDVTGAPAEIAKDEGGAFSCFGGQITGRHIELSPNTRIVQAWRAGPWDESVYSIVKFDIEESGSLTTVALTHTGFPDGGEEHLEAGWHKMYWEPMKTYFS